MEGGGGGVTLQENQSTTDKVIQRYVTLDIKLSLHMTLAETLRQRCLLSVSLCNVGRDFSSIPYL